MCPAEQRHVSPVMPEHVLSWAVNVFTVAVLPLRIGLLGAPTWFFLAYAMLAGAVVMLAEDSRYSHAILVIWN